MFKKIEIWVLYLILILSFLLAIGFGVLVRQELVGSVKVGAVSRSALWLAETPILLKAILAGTTLPDRFNEPGGFSGTPNSYESYLLLSRYDGDLGQGVVELVDLRSFQVLHTWNPDLDAINSQVAQEGEFKRIAIDNIDRRDIFRHPLLMEDGKLLFKRRSPLREIDKCSRLVYQNTRDMFHHSLERDYEGNIWAPTSLYPTSLDVSRVGDQEYLDDAIVKLSPSGEVLYEKSVSQILIENDMEYLLVSVGDKGFTSDPIHLNDIEPVNTDGGFLSKVDIFLSLRHQSMVLLFRPSTNKILWKGVGPFFHQHDVDIIDDGRISIFNNNSKDFVGGNVVDGSNEIVVYDFSKNKFSTYLSSAMASHDVRTITEGRSQILPNGDLFVEESNYARTILFDSDGVLRWKHLNISGSGETYPVGWSRILYTEKDIQRVQDLMTNSEGCN